MNRDYRHALCHMPVEIKDGLPRAMWSDSGPAVHALFADREMAYVAMEAILAGKARGNPANVWFVMDLDQIDRPSGVNGEDEDDDE